MKILSLLLLFNLYAEAQFINFSFINPKGSKASNSKSSLNINPNSLGQDTFWYNPNKNYYKIFVKEKGIYRVTYADLIKAGVPANSLIQGNLELINNGISIPIDIVDVNNNGLFDSTDYFKFIGLPPQPTTPYTYLNIYNNLNVYWFSYQADSVNRYRIKDGHPTNSDNLITTTLQTTHYERDSLYERLGDAPDDHRDFWFWANAEARGGHPYEVFMHLITDSIANKINIAFPQATVRVNMQGITNESCNGFTHSAKVKINNSIIAGQKWKGQNSTTIEGNFNFSLNGTSGVLLKGSDNKFEVLMDADICPADGNDVASVNWFELDYWRWNDVNGNQYTFVSPPNRLGKNTYNLFNWHGNDMEIFIPSRGELIRNPLITNNADYSVQFTDSIGLRTEYFCYSSDSYLSPDSIKKSNGSNLRSVVQGADYIIITHPDFMSAAKRLADFRSKHLAGFTSPRVKIVNVFDIYDEFSYGLTDPMALRDFVKYAFEHWQGPAPTFVTLLGEMNYDYRHILAESRPNFIPSIPFETYSYGQSASDNLIACVEGNDLVPDLAIGRLSCSTVDEGNALIDKIINYPGDNSKGWRENVLLISGGEATEDEASYWYNDQSEFLDSTYLKTNGITASKVYRYPNKPELLKYQGDKIQIREAINKGSIFINYYGSSGKWNSTFTNDDISLLDNGARLPFISSATSDLENINNQDSFGDKFNQVMGKGSIGFLGSKGLKWWQASAYLNSSLFDEIFGKRNNLIGSAILNSETKGGNTEYISSQTALFSLLGDPALELAIPKSADFQVSPNDFIITPSVPIIGNNILIKTYIHNSGVIFSDSVKVSLYQTQIDSSHRIGVIKRGSFCGIDSVLFNWMPDKAGLYKLLIDVNSDNHIEESDHSDNQSTINLSLFDNNRPNIVEPVNGYTTNSNKIKFTLVNSGSYTGKNYDYRIMIDTSILLNSSARILSPVLESVDGIVRWNIHLPTGEYFWKALIFDNADTNSSNLLTFSINNSGIKGYSSINKQLNLFETYNMSYKAGGNSLIKNTEPFTSKEYGALLTDSLTKGTKGYVLTTDIGPALKWNSLKYSMDSTGSRRKCNAFILGLNKESGYYDTIKTNVPYFIDLSNVNPQKYEYLKLGLNYIDSTMGASEPLKLTKVAVDYASLPEISIHRNNFTFSPDTLLQGFVTNLSLKVYNLGESDADSVTLKFYANNADSVFLTSRISIPKDSSIIYINQINTTSWMPATLYKIKVILTMPHDELFTFNDIAEKGFYITRDSSKPIINITFDGKEIYNGDVVSARPEVLITLKDNSPIALDTTSFTTLKFDNVPLSFSNPDLKFSYIPYPNSQAIIKWTPKIADGKHTLEISARDPSNNYSDTASHKYDFIVYNTADITNVYNYPNPFKNDTYFTFEIRGQSVPDELKIKVFTVAGRMINEISIPPSELQMGFNKYYWNGKDHDGDELANGVYFYKIIAKYSGIVKTTIERLAKVK
ncbi:MAG: C25 family cysteine peptidase [Ignavibacteriaceae bacterium]|nr:C25 family cysteine peptidase [Ignavibacteriaceae bacterium]